jgi:hypothetical protein
MADPDAQTGATERSKNARIGISRFMVPHASFDWYVRGIGLSALGFGVVTGITSWAYHMELFDALGLASQPGWPELVAQYGRLSMLAAGAVAVTMAMFITLVSMFLFHRIVGPVYRLKLHMIAVANGEDVQPLRFRDGDQLADVGDAYNQLLVALDVLDADKLDEDAPTVPASGTPGTPGDPMHGTPTGAS